jgi:hypothetical protein
MALEQFSTSVTTKIFCLRSMCFCGLLFPVFTLSVNALQVARMWFVCSSMHRINLSFYSSTPVNNVVSKRLRFVVTGLLKCQVATSVSVCSYVCAPSKLFKTFQQQRARDSLLYSSSPLLKPSVIRSLRARARVCVCVCARHVFWLQVCNTELNRNASLRRVDRGRKDKAGTEAHPVSKPLRGVSD